jgi:hypothetical protein
MVDTPIPSERPSQTHQAEGPSSGPLETGQESRTFAETQDRDPGDAAGSLSPENADLAHQQISADDAGQSAFAQGIEEGVLEGARVEQLATALDDVGVNQELGGAPAPNVTAGSNEQEDARQQHARAQGSVGGEGATGADETRATTQRSIDDQGL